MTLPLAWCFARWPWTLHLVHVDRALSAELDRRALYSSKGIPAPQQMPPEDLAFWLTLAVVAVALLCGHLPHL